MCVCGGGSGGGERSVSRHYNPTQIPTSHRGLGSRETGRSGYTREKSCCSHLLWLFSSSDLAQKARISKSTPQALRRRGKAPSYPGPQALGRGGKAPSHPRLSSPLSQHTLSCLLASFPLGVDFCPITETGTLLPHRLLSSLAPGRGWVTAVHRGTHIPRHMFQTQ